MKNMILGFCLFVIGILSLVSILMLENQSIRKKEIQLGLSQSIESAVAKNVSFRGEVAQEAETESTADAKQTKKIFEADLIQSFIINLQSDSNISIDVMGIDAKKGVASLKIKEQFQNILGRSSEVSNQRTVIFNQIQKEEQKNYTLNFYLTKEDLLNKQNAYKSFEMLEHEKMICPQNPSMQGKTFLSWVDVNDYEADFSQDITQNIDFYASWE